MNPCPSDAGLNLFTDSSIEKWLSLLYILGAFPAEWAYSLLSLRPNIEDGFFYCWIWSKAICLFWEWQLIKLLNWLWFNARFKNGGTSWRSWACPLNTDLNPWAEPPLGELMETLDLIIGWSAPIEFCWNWSQGNGLFGSRTPSLRSYLLFILKFRLGSLTSSNFKISECLIKRLLNIWASRFCWDTWGIWPTCLLSSIWTNVFLAFLTIYLEHRFI